MQDAGHVPRWDEGHVEIGNRHDVPARFTTPREPIPVRARIDWATGEEWINTTAVGWTTRLVLVKLDDRRHNHRGIWLDPSDVERINPPARATERPSGPPAAVPAGLARKTAR